MKIVHTFLPVLYKEIPKHIIYLMTASMLLARRYYEKVVLYTDKKTANIVRQIGLPYDEINDTLLDNVKVGTFSIPKLLVYKDQKEPYIHIDLDSFLFKRILFNDKKSIYSTFDEGRKLMINTDHGSLGFYNTYIKYTYELLDNLPNDFVKKIDFTEVPNMSIFGGHNYELIAEATNYCLDIYEKNRNFFDGKFYNACIIEQLFIPTAIKLLYNKDNYRFNFLYSGIPNSIEFYEENCEYPFIINSSSEIIEFKNEFDLYANYDYDYNGYLHLCGFKNFDKMLYVLRTIILLKLDGESYLNRINKLFVERFAYEKDSKHYEEMKNLLINNPRIKSEVLNSKQKRLI